MMVIGPIGFVRSAVSDALEGGGRIAVVGSPAATVDAPSLLAANPDIVLVDADATGDGWPDEVRRVREVAPHAVVIILAVAATEAAVMEAVEAGALGYLSKDIGREALRAAVEGAGRGELAMSRHDALTALGRLQSQVAAHGRPGGEDGRLAGLTARELEVLALLAQGLTDRAIAERLSLSVRTVESHVGRIRHRLGVRSRAQAGLRYLRSDPSSRDDEPG